MADSNSPIFIVGANRSGTTLVRLLLNAHSRIAIPDELIYLDSSLAGVPIEQWRAPGLSDEDYAAFVDHFLDHHCRVLDEVNKRPLRRKILTGGHDFRRPYRIALETWAQQYGKERWGEKTPGNLFYADVLLGMFPEAQFLYVVRDPRAGVASMQNVSFFPDDVVFNALSRRKHDTKGRAFFDRTVPEAQRMTIRYEDLVRAPKTTIRSVCQFLGEPFEPAMLGFHEGADQYMKDDAQAKYNSTATQPITDDRIDTWRDQLTPDEVAIVESVCADAMQTFGYEPTGQAASLTTHAERLVKQAYWAWQCWRHRDVRHFTVKHSLFARTRSRLRRLSRHLFGVRPSRPE